MDTEKLPVKHSVGGSYVVLCKRTCCNNSMVSCRLKREEAKIAAWESLQKAKAEAEIRKLEVNSLLALQFIYHLSYILTFCSCNTDKNAEMP